MVPMELLQNIYAVLGIILLPLVFLALLVAACLPRERRKAVLQRLRRVQLPPRNWFAVSSSSGLSSTPEPD
jgi:hypothetical protein